jgi:predicted RNase H-like HicB family nuclease
MSQLITIQAAIQWRWGRNTDDVWIAECPALAQVVQAESFSEMLRTIEEVQNSLMQDLYEEGELDEFLSKHGWRQTLALPSPITSAPTPRFEVPFELLHQENERRRASSASA